MQETIELSPLFIPSSLPERRNPLAVALALVKNEADIIAIWLSHVCELFDVVYIVDHQSTDGTREFLLDAANALGKIFLFSFDKPGYFQSEITNKLAHRAAEENPNTWLFPLDADEFLSVTSAAEFSSSLKKVSADQILLLNWRNCTPTFLHTDQELHFNFPCFLPSSTGLYNKVAVCSSTLLKKNWGFIQGNHGLETETGIVIPLDTQTRFLDMLHIPIRSVDHFALKCIQGHIAYRQLPADRELGSQGSHWQEMINSVLSYDTLDPNMIRGFVLSYGQPNKLGSQGISIYELVDLGWRPTNFKVAHGDVLSNLMHRRRTFLQLAAQSVDTKSEKADLKRFLQIITDNQTKALDSAFWQQENYKGATKFNTLPVIELDDKIQYRSEIELLHFLMSKGFTYRENPVPSTWEGHVPFLYSLLNYQKPRRFVELGTHHGNCYFAACQASKEWNYSIECIAVDTWAGDEHTGAYKIDVFKDFLHILRRDYPHGKYIRDTFNNALRQFEAGSIDLLHIDGLHTYEAVAEDFVNWLPMLSNRGIIMIHDTQEHERGFGVWRLWDEVSHKYPSFEFTHSHGLGVLLVGDQAEPYIQKLFELAAQPEYIDFLRFFFSNVGRLSPLTQRN